MDKIMSLCFPGGNSQIDDEAEILHAMLSKRVPLADLRRILMGAKSLYCIEKIEGREDIDVSQIIQNRTKVTLSRTDLELIHRFFEKYFSNLEPVKHPEATESDGDFSEKTEMDLTIKAGGECYGRLRIINGHPEFELSDKDCSVIVLYFAYGAIRNLSRDQKKWFLKWAGLNGKTWNPDCYSLYALTLFRWLTLISDDTIRMYPYLAGVRRMCALFEDTPPAEVPMTEEIVELFLIVHGSSLAEAGAKASLVFPINPNNT